MPPATDPRPAPTASLGEPSDGLDRYARPQPSELVERMLAGDRRALARLLTLVENQTAEGEEALRLLPRRGAGERGHVIGFTGSPGAGKSTLVGKVIDGFRARGEKVGVLAIDPSSPFSHGALLGDRIRMLGREQDQAVYIRSLSSRGHPGGVAAATAGMARLLEAFGMGRILVETVGAGQSELAIMGLAQTVVLVFNPGAGDEIQGLKAGIMEIGDLLVVNKADLPGAREAAGFLKAALRVGPPPQPGSWEVPVLLVSAATGEGIDLLIQGLEEHRRYLEASGEGGRRRRLQAENELANLIRERLARQVLDRARREGEWDRLIEALSSGDLDPHTAADRLLGA